VSWIAGSLLVLAVGLAGGFAWYERSQPTTRVLALVATLAALAALGRVAFAPLPNVKPTTDIVLIAGYVLGGAPGFVVGAVAALSSNLFFGQGPWTPWQMVAWGAIGLLGALLARLSGRRLGRVPLALCCLLSGYLFGAVMNLYDWITFSGDHTRAKLIAQFASAFPFDTAHAVGNLVFCLAFGPLLVRALARYRTRFEVTWLPVASASLAALALAGAAGAGAPASAQAAGAGSSVPRAAGASAASVARPPAAPADDAPARARIAASPVNAAAGYLLRAQNADGGWGGAPGQASSPLYAGWVALGLAAAGHDPANVHKRASALAYLRAHAGGDLGATERSILAFATAGPVPAPLVRRLLAARDRAGSFGGQVNTTAFAILALRAAGRSPRDATLRRAADWLAGQADRDGGFNFVGRGGASDVDDTGAALQALVAAGRRTSATVRRAVAYVRGHQDADGGFALAPGQGSNAQSTAWAVQGLLAAGVNPSTVRRNGSRDAYGYLASLVGPGGVVRYSRTSAQTPVWVTGQALMALARKPLPLGRVH